MIENIGANLAPWSIGNYRVEFGDDKVLVESTCPLIFFHCVTDHSGAVPRGVVPFTVSGVFGSFGLEQLMVAWFVATGQAWSHGNLR